MFNAEDIRRLKPLQTQSLHEPRIDNETMTRPTSRRANYARDGKAQQCLAVARLWLGWLPVGPEYSSANATNIRHGRQEQRLVYLAAPFAIYGKCKLLENDNTHSRIFPPSFIIYQFNWPPPFSPLISIGDDRCALIKSGDSLTAGWSIIKEPCVCRRPAGCLKSLKYFTGKLLKPF